MNKEKLVEELSLQELKKKLLDIKEENFKKQVEQEGWGIKFESFESLCEQLEQLGRQDVCVRYLKDLGYSPKKIGDILEKHKVYYGDTR